MARVEFIGIRETLTNLLPKPKPKRWRRLIYRTGPRANACRRRRCRESRAKSNCTPSTGPNLPDATNGGSVHGFTFDAGDRCNRAAGDFDLTGPCSLRSSEPTNPRQGSATTLAPPFFLEGRYQVWCG